MNYPAYSDYKNSAYPLIDKIPIKWNLTRIDFRISKIKHQLSANEMNGEDVIHYSIPNVQEFGKGILESGSDVDSNKLLIDKKQLLVSKLNPRKKTICIADKDDEYRTIASSEFVQIIPESKELKLDYLYYFYLSDTLVQFLSSVVQSVTKSHQRANPDDIRKIYWYFPSSEEQQSIASFLDYKTKQIDDLIAKKEELLNLLEEKRIALITQAVTKGLDPNVKMKPSGIDWLGEIPEHWGLKQLKRAAQITYGIGGEIDKEVTEGVRLLSLPNVTFEGDIKLDDEFYIELNESEKKEYLLKKGDLLFNWRNGSSNHLAKTAIIDFEGEFTHVSFLLRLRFYERNESRYFRYLINSLRATGFFSSSKAGVNNTFNLTELSNLFLMIPPHEEQITISDFLDGKLKKMVSIQIVIEEAIERLKEYRTSLITSAVTGEIDVRDFKPERV